MKRMIIVFFLLVFFFLCTPCGGTNKALLIGIDDYKNLPSFSKTGICDLRGSVNDVKFLERVLVEQYGFSQGDVRVLINQEATRRGIEQEFDRWLVQGTGKGDLVLFYFSGHGSQVPDFNGDEADGMDEVLCPCDVVPSGGRNIILDDELGMWLRRLGGRDVVVIIDSCHSGTATRGAKGTVLSYLEGISSLRPKFLTITDYRPSLAKAMPVQGDEPEGVVFMAASQEKQLAYETNVAGKFFGGFTYGLYDGLKNLKRPTYLRLFEHAKEVVMDRLNLPQDPRLEIEAGRKDLLVFTIPERERPHQPQPGPEVHAPSKPKPPPKPQPPLTPAEVVGEQVLVALEPLEGASSRQMQQVRDKLSGDPLVRLVSEDSFFDRLIRGTVEGSIYNVRLLNRLGDIERVGPAQTIDELMQNLKPHFEYAFMVKQLARIHHPNPPFKVELWVTDKERRDFRLGEQISFGFRTEDDCYILLLNLDSEGNVHIIFPNEYNQDNFVRAGQEVKIPDEKMRRTRLEAGKPYFELEFGPPAGEETVKVIATERRLRLDDLGLEDFKKLFDTHGMISVPPTTRTILVKKVLSSLTASDFAWSEATVVIRSH